MDLDDRRKQYARKLDDGDTSYANGERFIVGGNDTYAATVDYAGRQVAWPNAPTLYDDELSYVGYIELDDGSRIYLQKAPSWLQRLALEWVFDWKWVEEK